MYPPFWLEKKSFLPASIEIVQALAEHLPLLSEYWYDAAVLRQQIRRRYQIPSEPRKTWEQIASSWLRDDANIYFRVVLLNGELIGCIQADTVQNADDVLAYGCINELIMDMHTQQDVHGVGRALVDTAKTWLEGYDITQIRINTPIITPVEQAFWQGMGIFKKDDIFWLTIG